MSSKYIHQITPFKKNILRERDLEPPWQAYGYVQWHYFLYEYLHVLKTMKTKLLTRYYPKIHSTLHHIFYFFNGRGPRISQSRYRYGNYDTVSLFSCEK